MPYPATPDSHPLANVYARMRDMVAELLGTGWVQAARQTGVNATGFDVESNRTAGMVTLTAGFNTTSAINANTPLFTVAEGHRPSRYVRFTAAVPTGINTVVVLTVFPDGNVTAQINLGAGSSLQGSVTYPAAV